jgi:RNA polymerase sigma factor (sigma-70 family)
MNAAYTQRYEEKGRPITNNRLVGDLRAGFEDAWYQLYDVYWDWLLGIALSMGVRRENACDLVQKTFIALSKHISEFIYERAKGRFSGWLVTVLRRNMLSFWEARKRDPLSLLVPRPEEETQIDPVEGIAGPARDEVITKVLLEELERMTREGYDELKTQLSVEQWAVFEAYNIQELPVEVVAARFGLRPGSVYSIDCRCIRRFRPIMARKLEAARKESEVFTTRLNLQQA